MHSLSALAWLAGGDVDPAAGLVAGMIVIWLVMALAAFAVFAFVIYCYWRICTKAGFAGPMALLMLVPGIGMLILVLMLAFADWPVHQQLPRS